ncbi:MAG: ribosome maturation factor RimM [Lachnospiraceae bacterium]|nr:ribosome maturation factor RimM [Lachnospiraceae bacterium]
MDDLFEIGIISGTHGLKGALKIFPTTDTPERFLSLKNVIIEYKSMQKDYKVLKTAFHKQFVLLSADGITDIDSAMALKGGRLLVKRSEAVPLANDEYYMKDLYGLSVYNENSKVLGEISDIIITGANDVYVVKTTEGGELLIPAIKQCIINIDITNKKMTVHLLEGLKEL